MRPLEGSLKEEQSLASAGRILLLRTAPWEMTAEVFRALSSVTKADLVFLGQNLPHEIEMGTMRFQHWPVSEGFLSLFKLRRKYIQECRRRPFDVVVVPCRKLTGNYENVLEMLSTLGCRKILFVSLEGGIRMVETGRKNLVLAVMNHGIKEISRLLRRKRERRRKGIKNVRRWLKREGRHALFRPHALKIETTNICNAQCVFCLYPAMKRKKTILSIELFRKAIDEYVSVGGGALSLSPVVGEILLDPHLLERLRYARSYQQITSIGFYTNMIALSRWTDDEIIEMLSLLDGWECSLAPNRKAYQELYGLDAFESVVSNLERLAVLAEGVSPGPRISLQGRAFASDEVIDERLIRLAERLTDSKRFVLLSTYANWGGEVQNLPANERVQEKIARLKKVPCSSPFEAAVVFSNGEVGLCPCADGNGLLVIGDLTKDRLPNILSGRKRRDEIESFMNGKLNPFCARCTFYRALNPDEVECWPVGGNAFHQWPIRSNV